MFHIAGELKNILKHARTHTHTLSKTLVLLFRHLLRVVLRRDHAEYQPAQPKREGQTFGSTLHGHEQRHQ